MTKLETFSRMLFANNRLLFDDISFFFYDACGIEGETSYFDIQLLDADGMLYHPDEMSTLIDWLERNCNQEEDLGDDNSKYVFDNFYVLMTHGGIPLQG